MKVLVTGKKPCVSLEAIRDVKDKTRKINGLENPATLSIYPTTTIPQLRPSTEALIAFM